jgi:hypothetical protein
LSGRGSGAQAGFKWLANSGVGRVQWLANSGVGRVWSGRGSGAQAGFSGWRTAASAAYGAMEGPGIRGVGRVQVAGEQRRRPGCLAGRRLRTEQWSGRDLPFVAEQQQDR